MPNLVGIGNSQIPTNAMLGGLAYQDSVGEIDIEKIKARTSDTATDIFVYDTRKDSDGGAWRHRTQNTSWYNEGVSQGRGARKEFPSVAVIVAYNNGLRIYDGDDPNLPMWMEAWQYLNDTSGTTNWWGGSGTGTSVAAMNGTVVLGTTTGAKLLHFISDRMSIFYGSAIDMPTQPGGIASRNISYVSWSPIDEYFALIAHNNIEDVAMTVLPNAPIDINTGLPIPTFAVATDGGVSVIRDDRKVYDTVATTSGYVQSRKVEFSESGEYLYIIQDPSLIYSYKTSAFNIDRSSGTLSGYAALSFFSGYVSSSGPASTTKLSRGNDTTINIGHTNTGLALLYPDYTYSSNGLDNASGKMICRVTKDFNTGWMHGDIKGSFLSSIDDTDLSGTSLIANGDFSSNSTAAFTTVAGGTAAVVGGLLKLTDTGGAFCYASAPFTTVVGNQYFVTVDIVNNSNTAPSNYIRCGNSHNGTEFHSYNYGTAYGTKTFYFTATATTTYLTLISGHGSGNPFGHWDNVFVYKLDNDRSVSSKGLQPYGTITKEPVATGAELVAYSGFGANNYLQQPYNSDLDFGTGDLSIIFWYKLTSTGTPQCFIHRGDGGSGTWGSGNIIQIEMDTSHIEFQLAGPSFVPNTEAEVSVDVAATGEWQHFVAVRKDGRMHVYVDGVKYGDTASTQNVTNTSAKLWVGQRPNSSRPLSNGSMALLRMSSTAPTDEQIKKMYDDEKCLFHENAKCTLHGTSDDVTALAFDDTNGILHAGTSSGRSEFQGLNRINNTTTAVTTAISASNGFVAEQ